MRNTIYGLVFVSLITFAITAEAQQTYRLYYGITAYIVNEEGKDFDITLDVRDINYYANGPREILFKVYAPDGTPQVREFIDDDGVTGDTFQERIGGWDHEMMYYANLYAKGTKPTMRFSAWSDPNRLKNLKSRTIRKKIKGTQKGVYRLVLAGMPDHFVTMTLSPNLKYGICGHPSFIAASGNMLNKSYIYVPQNTSGLFFIALEPDIPRERTFCLKDDTGNIIFKNKAHGGYVNPAGSYACPKPTPEWQKTTADFKAGKYDNKILTFEATPGKNDFLVQLILQQPKKEAFKDYVGMGSQAIFCPDKATAEAIKGGVTVVDGDIFWHPFQIRFHDWLKKHPLDKTAEEKELRKELEQVYNSFRLIETSDGRGSSAWKNWAYAFGYYGCKIWRPCWLLMQRQDVPQELKNIIREGLLICGDRLSMAAGLERVNGNAFSQINVALWYGQHATKDPLLKKRFELFWDRWANSEGWGGGAGLSRSGDSQEHFAHDCHYGSYLMDNWLGITWVKGNILEDSKGIDPRFQQVIDRYRNLYSYLYCQEFPANPWSSRTAQGPHSGTKTWEPFNHPWKGQPGPDFTVSVNGGDEWFAARRKNYYFLSFHGKLAPEWMSRTFAGQLGVGGGILCQLTVPGKGTVLASTLNGSYGEDMDPSNWRNFHIHSVVGERWDGFPIITGISEHQDSAKLSGNTVSSCGEVRDAHVKISRSYTFKTDRIICSLSMAESDYAQLLSIWSATRKWSEIKEAYEMIPYAFKPGRNNVIELCTITVFDKNDKVVGNLSKELKLAKRIQIDRGGFGVNIVLPQEMPVRQGENHTVLIQLTDKEVKPEKLKLTYELVPYQK